MEERAKKVVANVPRESKNTDWTSEACVVGLTFAVFALLFMIDGRWSPVARLSPFAIESRRLRSGARIPLPMRVSPLEFQGLSQSRALKTRPVPLCEILREFHK